jgi:thymidylate synthase (FAD)
MKMRHGTPFEQSGMTFFVHAPIFVWREWHRHRIGMSYNEESGRYKQLDPVFYMPPKARPMFKVDDWKPGKPKFLRYDEVGNMHDQTEAEAKYLRLIDNLKECYQLCYDKYVENLNMGFDPGLARDCLPVGIYSSCWVTCNPRSLMHFLSLRTHEESAKFVSYPLYEIEVAARLCEEIFKEGWPITYKAFNDFGRVAP